MNTPPSGWKKILDIDFLYKWATLLVIPAYAVTTEIRSQIFVFYAVLFVMRVWRHGYVSCGLEAFFVFAMVGLGVSWIGTDDGRVMKDVLQVARVLCLPLLMCQYRPIRKLEYALAVVFSGLAVYGMARMLFAPIVTGYAGDRPYCFSDFFMHSSVIAFSGYIFHLLMFIRKDGTAWKMLGAANVLVFAALIAMHGVRASYLAFLVVTPVVLLAEFRKKAVAGIACLLLCAAVMGGCLCIARPGLAAAMAQKAGSIVDMSNGSNRGRLVFWEKAVHVFRENPVNGIGYRKFNRRNVDLQNAEFDWAFWHAHSEFFSMIAETGLIGTIAWIAFKLKLLVMFFRQRKNWIGAFMLYLFLAFEIHNVFECYLYERTAYIFVYVLLGLGLNQVARKRVQSCCRGDFRLAL